MSQALQRVVVRMLVDESFAREVHAGCALPELSEAERTHLRAVDPRAFRTDPYRRSRMLQACMEELPVAVALLTRGGRDLPAADAFFSSNAFHAAIQERGVLTLAMGAWLEERVGPLARLELSVARARRRRHPFGAGLTLAPRAWPLAWPEGSLADWQRVRQALGPSPVETLITSHVSLPSTSTHVTHDNKTAPASEHLLVRVSPDGNAGLEGSSEGIDALLRAALEPRTRVELLGVLGDEGAPPDVADEILAELLEEGTLVEARPPRTS